MDANQRIDYFRSELLGLVEKARKETTEIEPRLTARIKTLEDTVSAQARKIHELMR